MLDAEAPQARQVVAAGLVWLAPRQLLVQRRSDTAAFGANMLELPGGKVEHGEDPADALRRELREEWGPHATTLDVGAQVHVVDHAYARGPSVRLAVYHVDGRGWCGTWRERIAPEPGLIVVAFDCGQLPIAEFLGADRGLLAGVRAGDVLCPWPGA